VSGGAWLRLQALGWKTPKIAGLSNGAFRLWIATLSEAKLQRPGGSFGSRLHWRQCVGGLGSTPKEERELVDAGILEEAPRLCGRCLESFHDAPDGTLVVHDWADFQINTGADRQKRYVERHKSVTANVTSDAKMTPDNDRDNDSDRDSDRKRLKRVKGMHSVEQVLDGMIGRRS
jgi:hypothetical protein